MGNPISSGFCMGISDCSCKVTALPSQKKYGRFFMFKTDGVFLAVSFPLIPVLNAVVSANAYAGLWQLAQLTEESNDNIFSENNFLPRAALVFMSAFFC